MKRAYIISVILLLLTGDLYAQQNKTLNVSGKVDLIAGLPNLNIGDQLPDFEIPVIINGTKRSMRSSAFKDQLLIIDFWSIYCSGCIAAMPKMDSLQKHFGDKIKILPVTYEAETLVTNFWKKNRNTKNLGLSSVVEDKIFSSYFRHQTIPHEAWIYQGKVIAITTEQYVDKTNIQKVLNGELIKWPIKNDFYVFDGSKEPLFKVNTTQVNPSSIINYAAISGYKEQVNSEGLSGGSGVVRDPNEKKVRVFFLNQAIFTSYELNWRNIINPTTLVRPSAAITPNQIVWQVTDRSRYKYEFKTDYQANWIRKNGICFESLNPDTGQTQAEISRSIVKNLNYLLGLDVRWEKRKEKILVLIRTTDKDKLKSKTVLTDYKDQFKVEGNIQRFRSTNLTSVVYKLNEQEQNPYVFDETGYKNEVDLDLNIHSWTDIASIRKALQAYDLDLKEEERLVDKFVFAETEGSFLKEIGINKNKL
ncbi:redoxin domain-containing protein [Pedobacter sp. FW305-3-2-15-E-R2A2]|uniref:TlpA family protein disulfide reductase n=1 Tax=Pedobacter sp. FW305-3-2-15-E-R2A2 TaxID=3140251 RepID=UPI0031409C4C